MVDKNKSITSMAYKISLVISKVFDFDRNGGTNWDWTCRMAL